MLHIFCTGAVSHLDTWDYNRALWQRDGQPMPGIEKLVTFQGENGNLARSPWTFRQRGQTGKWVSDLLPHLAECADELCFVHSLTSKTNTHGPGEMFMSTGFTLEGFPSAGAWVSYALGTENQDLPAYVAIPDPRATRNKGRPTGRTASCRPSIRGRRSTTAGRSATWPGRPRFSPGDDRAVRDFLSLLNDLHLKQYPGDAELSARIAAYSSQAGCSKPPPRSVTSRKKARRRRRCMGSINREPADCRVQPKLLAGAAGCSAVCDLSRCTMVRLQWVKAAQLGRPPAHPVRLHPRHAPILDQPAAALLIDLKSRGLLEDTLVVWTTEFGRMPTFQKGTQGRDHNPKGFTAWLAGAGVKHGFSFGATDEFGYQAVENVVDVHDFHATILHLLGLDHTRLTTTTTARRGDSRTCMGTSSGRACTIRGEGILEESFLAR